MAPASTNTPKEKATKKGTTTKSKAKSDGDGSGTKNSTIEDVEQRILSKMAERSSFGVSDFTIQEVVKFSGYSWSTVPK